MYRGKLPRGRLGAEPYSNGTLFGESLFGGAEVQGMRSFERPVPRTTTPDFETHDRKIRTLLREALDCAKKRGLDVAAVAARLSTLIRSRVTSHLLYAWSNTGPAKRSNYLPLHIVSAIEHVTGYSGLSEYVAGWHGRLLVDPRVVEYAELGWTVEQREIATRRERKLREKLRR